MVVGLERLIGRVVEVGGEKFGILVVIFHEKTLKVELICSNMKDRSIKKIDLESTKVMSP